jgi:large subunit ribosomal protein L25
MAKQTTLKAQARTETGPGAVRRLRRQGIIPANVYGDEQQALPLQLAERDINNLLRHAASEQVLVELAIEQEGNVTNRLALIQEIQHEPLSRRVLHVDFQAVASDEKLVADVPIEPRGEPVGVRTMGGLLEQSLRAIEVRCLPRDLPELIEIDVSELALGDSLHVRDIPLGEGIELVTSADLTVFVVAAPRVVEEEAAAPAAEGAEPAEPEVIREKKAEGGEEKEGKDAKS